MRSRHCCGAGLNRPAHFGKPRAVPVGAHFTPLLADWLRVRPKASPSDFLFVTNYGTQLHRESWGTSVSPDATTEERTQVLQRW